VPRHKTSVESLQPSRVPSPLGCWRRIRPRQAARSMAGHGRRTGTQCIVKRQLVSAGSHLRQTGETAVQRCRAHTMRPVATAKAAACGLCLDSLDDLADRPARSDRQRGTRWRSPEPPPPACRARWRACLPAQPAVEEVAWARERCRNDLAQLPQHPAVSAHPTPPVPDISPTLRALTDQMRHDLDLQRITGQLSVPTRSWDLEVC
jgi:hypothetical protein